MKLESWRSKGRGDVEPWRLQARKAANIAARKGFSGGGLPRRNAAKPISLPKLKFQEETNR